MSISPRTRKMLWGRAASRCSFHDCRRELVMDRSETDEESLIGDECHIVAKEPTRSRGESPLTPEQRDEYENLILMCKNHHKLIDDQPQTYSIQKLKEMKAHHEKWVRETLTGFDPAKQRDEEQYSECVERWVEDVELDNWIDWSSRWIFMSPRPAISYEKLDAFENLRLWLDSRVWPKRYPELEYAFENFRRVLYDLESVHYRHSTQGEVRRDYSVTDKYYHFVYDSNGRELKTKQEKRKEYELHHELCVSTVFLGSGKTV